MNESQAKHASDAPPRWMVLVLTAAAVYNLLWGAWVILRPLDLFALTGAAQPRYVAIWQCVGMIVGVYGVGYWVAARDPLRHWPIVLVGWLGKTLGPIGMVSHLATVPPDAPGRLPASWLWINLTNDLIWWVPFAAILYQAFKLANAPRVETTGESFEQCNGRFRSQLGESIAELSRRQPVLVVFLRHSGCTFCREALEDLKRQRRAIESGGAAIAIVHMGDNQESESFFASYGLGDVHRISDPRCELYRAYQLPRGGVAQLLGPAVWWRGFKAAILNRHGVGKLGGDGFQMPGAFVVRENRITRAYRHATAASRPDYCELVQAGAETVSAA